MSMSFKQFLEQHHSKLYPTLLDDDLPDAFDDYMSEKEQDELINLAELWGKGQYLSGQAHILDGRYNNK